MTERKEHAKVSDTGRNKKKKDVLIKIFSEKRKCFN